MSLDGISRRKCLYRLSVGTSSLFFFKEVCAGGQLEEPLADSVRSALSSAIANSAPPVPEFADTASRLAYLRWLTEKNDQLRRYKTELQARTEFLQTKGAIDIICDRRELRTTVANTLAMLQRLSADAVVS